MARVASRQAMHEVDLLECRAERSRVGCGYPDRPELQADSALDEARDIGVESSLRFEQVDADKVAMTCGSQGPRKIIVPVDDGVRLMDTKGGLPERHTLPRGWETDDHTVMRPAAELLLLEATALRPILESTDAASFDLETVCTGWSVRDVLAHCGAALTRAASGDLHRFTPEDNQRDVDIRKAWPVTEVLDELFRGYVEAASAIDAAGGPLDGIGLGEWVHGGDVRDALEVGGAYSSKGSELAVELLLERSRALDKSPIDVAIEGRIRRFGGTGSTNAEAVADTPTFVRLCGGRSPTPADYTLRGCRPQDFVLFG